MPTAEIQDEATPGMIHPANLLDGVLPLGERQWHALYTKSRQEKVLASQLRAQAIPCYLPLTIRPTVTRGRTVEYRVPVFSNYVFMFGDADERVRALKTNRISRVLPVADGQQLRCDLSRLARLLTSGARVTVESQLEPGDRVRVRSGRLAGLEGTVLTRRAKIRLLVAVNYLQQGASVEIEDFRLEPTGN